jgi:hypothetical protein
MMNGSATLTELEMTKLENYALRDAGLRQAQQANLAERARYIARIEAAHPGHSFSEQTGQLVSNGPTEAESLAQAQQEERAHVESADR